jgi:hypothetical protein
MHLRTWRNRQTRSPEKAVVGGSSPLVRIRICRYGAIGRRGSLKNCILKVRILLPAWVFVGVAQMEERERAKLEVGSSNLLTHFISTSGRVDIGNCLQSSEDRFDSGGVLF